MRKITFSMIGFCLAGILALASTPVFASSAFIGHFNTNSMVALTVPANGDINPYGVAVVTRSVGSLVKGDVLVSNFNNSANAQGTGTTIVEVAPNGTVQQFAEIKAADLPGACPGGVGLTTALVVLREGWVIVGSLPTSDGTSATAQAGCLIVFNARGHAVETISGRLINGPWDMIASEHGGLATLFVTNVLNGTLAASPAVVNKGTVVRLVLSVSDDHAPRVLERTVVASGFGERTDPNALVIGPTGVDLAKDGTLYVADTLANRVAAVPHALTRYSSAGIGKTVSVGGGLNGPLGLAVVPGGDVVVANSNDGNFVEITPGGAQVAVMAVDSTGIGGGTLFGLAVAPGGKGVYFVNDGNNTLNLLH
jgi:hypothetical protein